jgi:hypothetical protein
MANVSNEELKWLWLCLERLQKDTQPGGAWGIWNEKERAALVTVMDAVKETYSEPL